MRKPVLYSIKAKFVLISALIVASFALFLGSSVVREEKEHLLLKLQDNGRILMTCLKAPIINSIILGEIGIQPGLLDNYVEEIVQNRQLAASYAFITDEGGRVLAHSGTAQYGKVYNDPLTRQILQQSDFRCRVVKAGSSAILDMALPLRVSGKCWGALRVGLSMAPLDAELRALEKRVALRSGLIFLLGTVIFYVVGHSMARPLVRLSQAMEGVSLGGFEAMPLPARRDEIGLLQESFADMLKRLSHSEQEREQAQNYLIQNEKMISIGKIVAGVAHEINNPLATISACIYKLEGTVPPEGRSSLAILKESVPRMETIVRQLCDFSRAGTLHLQAVPSDVFFEEIRAFGVMALKKYRTRLHAVDHCLPPVTLTIDKTKLHQVVLNLLLNATAASGYAGSVELRTSIEPGWYLLTVTDDGCGIEEKDREKIFDIFYTTKRAGEGSGIGLAVCKSIVDLHRGSITVLSVPGRTVIEVRVPLKAERVDA